MTISAARGAGWEQIGLSCSTDVRSLWIRVSRMGPIQLLGPDQDGDMHEVLGRVVMVELCSGREGMDEYVSLRMEDFHDAHRFGALVAVLTTQLWGQGT